MTVEIRQSTADPIAVDTGNVAVQGKIVSKTIQFPMFTINENAVWAERQHLLKAGYPFALLKLSVNRRAFRILVGECFRFSYAKYGINNAIFRVLQKEEHELESEQITITAIEDFYSVSRTVQFYSVPTGYVERPDYSVVPLVKQRVIEAPYAMTQIEDPAVLAVACAERQFDLGFIFHISVDGGTSYSEVSALSNLVPYGELVDQAYPPTFTIDDERGFFVEFRNNFSLEQFATTSWQNVLPGIEHVGLLGNEIIFFKDITPVSELKYKIENIIRARMDTRQMFHNIGTGFYILHKDLTIQEHEFIAVGATLHFKLVPYNSKRQGSIADATPISMTIAGRRATPYVPSNFCANGRSFAARYDSDIILTWSPRYRGKGAGIGIPGKILASSEREGLFAIRVLVNNVVVRTALNIDSDTWTYTQAMNLADNGSLPSEVKFRLTNYNGVYESAYAEVVCKKNI